MLLLCEKNIVMGTCYNLPDSRLNEIKKEAERFNEAWTKEEIERVCQLFRNGMRVDEIAGTVHRTKNAIRIKLLEAGEIARFLSRRGEPWTDEETERLGRFHSQGYPVSGCARLLGRLRNEVEDKLIDIGLMSPREKSVRNPDYPNAYTPWSEEESGQLRQELSDYVSVLTALAQIAKAHGRSLSSIVSRATRIGLFSLE